VKWTPPREGSAKLNTDGSFVSSDDAGAGMVLRDHQGIVIVAATRHLVHCADALEPELAAIEEGLGLALSWTPMGFTVESDCAEALELIKESTPNTSIYASRIQVIRERMRERDIRMAKAFRETNVVSHKLANLGRVHRRSEVWTGNFPQDIAAAITYDCNSIAS
jgi:hypothetical protein